MAAAFPEALVTGYEPLIPSLDLPDEKDRHVLASAIRCGAQIIVTDNLKDFPGDILSDFDIEAISADEFLTQTFRLYPYDALPVAAKIRRKYDNPPYSASEFIMDLTAKGLPMFAAELRELKHLI